MLRRTIPVTLLTGFLGSGKTTLLNQLLADPRMSGTAVIVNEFGSVSVDHDLVRRGRESYVISSTGCLCCTASSDIRVSLHELAEDQRQGEIPPIRRVIIETTGLADPAPIINSLIPGGAPAVGLRDHTVARAFHLAGVVCTFDAEHGPDTLETQFECCKQLAFADHIVLTKTDLVVVDGLVARLRPIAPTAAIHDRSNPDFDPVTLIGRGSYSLTDKPEDVPGWLAMERLIDPANHGHAQADAQPRADDPNRHGGSIEALPLLDDEPLDPRAVEGFLDVVTQQPHAGLLRMKGILALADDPARPMVVHAIQHRLYPPVRLDYWPSADVRSRVMIIGRDMPLEPIRALFAALRPRRALWRRLVRA